MIRDRFALAVLGVTVGFFTTLAAVANIEDVPRNIDIVVLWLVGLLQLGLLLTWVFIPRLPRWIVAGWGLILVAAGVGVIITAPVRPVRRPSRGLWWASSIGGIVTMIMAAVHSPAPTRQPVLSAAQPPRDQPASDALRHRAAVWLSSPPLEEEDCREITQTLGLLAVTLLLTACSGPVATQLPSASVAAGALERAQRRTYSRADAEGDATAAPHRGGHDEAPSRGAKPCRAERGSDRAAGHGDARREHSGERQPQPAAVCGPIESLSTKTPGRLTLSTDNPGVPAVVGRRSRPSSTPTSRAGGDDWEVSDPYSMEGYRRRDRICDRERHGLHAGSGRLGPEHCLRAGVRAGPQAVRLPHGPDLDPAQACPERRLQRPVLQRQSGAAGDRRTRRSRAPRASTT